jgi:type IV fimbrial biogenesis protein FimT
MLAVARHGVLNMKAPDQRGLTLIELMVTLSLAVLLTLAVVPAISTWLGNLQIRNVAGSIQSGLQRARNEAVRRNMPVRFTMVSLDDTAVMSNSCAAATDGVSWVVSLDDPAGLCSTAASDTSSPRIIDKRAGGIDRKSVVVSSATAAGVDSNGVVIFNGFGRVVGSDGPATIDVDNVTPGGDFRALRIVIGAGGSTRLCEPRVSSADDPRHC